MLTLKHLSEIFNRAISKDRLYQEALGVVKRNSRGRTWLIGGAVYRALVKELYGNGKEAKDFDFIVEKAKPKIELSDGWTIGESRFGNPKFVKGNAQIDFVPIDRVIHIVHYGLTPNTSNFLSKVPFNIHSLAYDTRRKKVIGEIGREALEDRVVRVNDLEMARIYAEKYGVTINDRLRKTANELGFSAELI